MAQKWRFLACWAKFFAEMPLEGLCWASFFADRQPCDPVGRTLSRRSPGRRPSTGSVNPSMRSYTLWVAWWAACLGHHPSGQRAHEGARAASCRLECGGWVQRAAAGCNVRRLGVARKRSGVMCGWLCSRVRTGTPRPNPGGALPQPTIRRSAVPPEWRT